jgi:hypothetical protein
MNFVGKWHIYEMDMWNEEYSNKTIQGFVEIENSKIGRFQIGVISGELEGKLVEYYGKESFEFTFEGTDECDPISGCGWMLFRERDIVKGEFRFYLGSNSTFLARRA